MPTGPPPASTAPRRPVTLRRAVVVWVVVWAVTLAALRLTVALPESCPTVGPAAARDAAGAAVDWFARNQAAEGTFTYLHHPATGAVPDAYNRTRHAGVLLSLYQAADAGFGTARPLADAGLAWIRERYVEHEDWTAVGVPDRPVRVGATALLVAALAERREVTGDPAYDDDLAALGRFLAQQVQADGSVPAAWDPATGAPVPDRFSPFFTGEAFWALARLHTLFPDAGWRDPALRVGRYLATDRDRVEDRFPPSRDHWAAYGLAEVGRWSGDLLDRDPALRPYSDRLAGLLVSKQRFQSKATDDWLGRRYGGPLRGAALGTTGEALGALWRLAGRGAPALADRRPQLAHQLACQAGILVARQVTAAEAARHRRPALVRGAWLAHDETRMDDQQHALSALLAAVPALEEGRDDG